MLLVGWKEMIDCLGLSGMYRIYVFVYVRVVRKKGIADVL